MKYSKLIATIIALFVVLFSIVGLVPSDMPDSIYNVVRCIIIGITCAMVVCAILLIVKALIDTIKYIFVDDEKKTAPKYKIYKQVQRKTVSQIEALYMVYSNFTIYKFKKMILSEIVNLNKKGIIIFENNDFNPENSFIVKLTKLDEATRSNLSNIEKYILIMLEEMFEVEDDGLVLDELNEKINNYINNINRSSFGSKKAIDPLTQLYFAVANMAKKDFINNKIIDEVKSNNNFNVLVRIGIFMVVLAIPLIALIPLSVFETLDKLLTLPFIWWHLLVIVGSFGLISSIFGFFKKDDYTVEGREERAKWKGFKNYLKSNEIIDDIKSNNNLITDILPYLFVLDAPKKLISIVLENMDETTLDMKAIKIMYKSVM